MPYAQLNGVSNPLNKGGCSLCLSVLFIMVYLTLICWVDAALVLLSVKIQGVFSIILRVDAADVSYDIGQSSLTLNAG